MRVLQSKGRLVSGVTVTDPLTGQLKTRHFEVQGPVAYLETTTSVQLNLENATRCFELFLDESTEQTLRIHQRQREARTLEGRRRQLAARAIRERHHQAQRLLESVKIVIPWVQLLRFPVRWLRTRRDHERFLCLVEAVAFLHQHQRLRGEMEGFSYIEATPDDYRLAYQLAAGVLRATFHELPRSARELWTILLELARESGEPASSASPAGRCVNTAVGPTDDCARPWPNWWNWSIWPPRPAARARPTATDCCWVVTTVLRRWAS